MAETRKDRYDRLADEWRRLQPNWQQHAEGRTCTVRLFDLGALVADRDALLAACEETVATLDRLAAISKAKGA